MEFCQLQIGIWFQERIYLQCELGHGSMWFQPFFLHVEGCLSKPKWNVCIVPQCDSLWLSLSIQTVGMGTSNPFTVTLCVSSCLNLFQVHTLMWVIAVGLLQCSRPKIRWLVPLLWWLKFIAQNSKFRNYSLIWSDKYIQNDTKFCMKLVLT